MYRSTRRALLKIIVSIALAVPICLGLGYLWTNFWDWDQEGTPTLPQLASYTGIEFPKSARLVRGYYVGFQDYENFAIIDFDYFQLIVMPSYFCKHHMKGTPGRYSFWVNLLAA